MQLTFGMQRGPLFILLHCPSLPCLFVQSLLDRSSIDYMVPLIDRLEGSNDRLESSIERL